MGQITVDYNVDGIEGLCICVGQSVNVVKRRTAGTAFSDSASTDRDCVA